MRNWEVDINGQKSRVEAKIITSSSIYYAVSPIKWYSTAPGVSFIGLRFNAVDWDKGVQVSKIYVLGAFEVIKRPNERE